MALSFSLCANIALALLKRGHWLFLRFMQCNARSYLILGHCYKLIHGLIRWPSLAIRLASLRGLPGTCGYRDAATSKG